MLATYCSRQRNDHENTAFLWIEKMIENLLVVTCYIQLPREMQFPYTLIVLIIVITNHSNNLPCHAADAQPRSHADPHSWCCGDTAYDPTNRSAVTHCTYSWHLFLARQNLFVP